MKGLPLPHQPDQQRTGLEAAAHLVGKPFDDLQHLAEPAVVGVPEQTSAEGWESRPHHHPQITSAAEPTIPSSRILTASLTMARTIRSHARFGSGETRREDCPMSAYTLLSRPFFFPFSYR